MSSYNGRRAPNVSQYIANLNTVPSSHDVPGDLTIPSDADLDFLTNAEFFDFDSFTPPNAVDGHHPSPRGGKPPVNGGMLLAVPEQSDMTHSDSKTGHQFQFGEFQTYPNQLHGQYPPQPAHQLSYSSPQTGEKRKSSVSTGIASPQDLEEQSRMAAEEDKRRRNTAASARFRVKKKQREQALEKQAKEMTEKVQQLEGKVQQLEMENKWLKGLITDKNDGKSLESMQKETDVDDRKPSDPRRGVGTAEEDVEDDGDDEDVQA
jgi:hypothetical protein